MSLKPRLKVPDLSLPTVDGARFTLSDSRPPAFTLIVAYRGLHCPICKTYLRDLDRKLSDFEKLGVAVVTISTDDRTRATQTKQDWGLGRLMIAYDFAIDEARRWNLYISAGIKDEEPPLFAEPGLFLIRPDQTLYAASIQTMPFARPQISEVLGAVKFVTEHNYPARGEA